MTDVALRSTAAASAGTAASTAPARSLHVLGWQADSRSVRIGPGQETYLEVHQNASPGWEATLNGHRLASATLDGWQQGFIVPAGAGGVITMTFAPSTWYHIGLALAALALIGLVCVAAGWRRWMSYVIPAVYFAVLETGTILLLSGTRLAAVWEPLEILSLLARRRDRPGLRPVPPSARPGAARRASPARAPRGAIMDRPAAPRTRRAGPGRSAGLAAALGRPGGRRRAHPADRRAGGAGPAGGRGRRGAAAALAARGQPGGDAGGRADRRHRVRSAPRSAAARSGPPARRARCWRWPPRCTRRRPRPGGQPTAAAGGRPARCPATAPESSSPPSDRPLSIGGPR